MYGQNDMRFSTVIYIYDQVRMSQQFGTVICIDDNLYCMYKVLYLQTHPTLKIIQVNLGCLID